MGQQSLMNMSYMGMAMGGKGGGKGGKMAMGGCGWGMPMGAKRPKTMGTGNAAKDALVEKIKAFQRSGEESKQAWWSYVADHGDIRDPARHEVHVFQQFISGMGI